MLRFNNVLVEAGIDPAEVRLLRHLPEVAGRSMLDTWRNDTALFEAYQSVQPAKARASFSRPWWASFIGTWDGRTVFVGLYNIGQQTVPAEGHDAITERVLDPANDDRYAASLSPVLDSYRGRLFIEWGGGPSGKRAWNQRADAQDKLITELHRDVAQAPFPGLLALNTPLSALDAAPPSWIEPLAAAKGVYLLTCPRDGSHYVGSATGAGGFWARWSEYRANGHGGNVALVARERSDCTATILEVAGSTATSDDILVAEARWKAKLQTGTWGLTRN